MKHSIVLLFLTTFLSTSLAQERPIQYWDLNWDKCSKEEAQYFGVWEKTGDAHFIEKVYFISGALLEIGHYSSLSPRRENGRFTYYYENGQKRQEGKVKNVKEEGMWRYWYENGQKMKKGKYKDGQQVGTWVYWSDKGEKSNIVILPAS